MSTPPSPSIDDQAQKAHARKVTALIALVSMGAGIGFTYVLPMDDWSMFRRIGAGSTMGLWCVYLMTMTRLGGAFK